VGKRPRRAEGVVGGEETQEGSVRSRGPLQRDLQGPVLRPDINAALSVLALCAPRDLLLSDEIFFFFFGM
jgi:hypothetical protein